MTLEQLGELMLEGKLKNVKCNIYPHNKRFYVQRAKQAINVFIQNHHTLQQTLIHIADYHVCTI